MRDRGDPLEAVIGFGSRAARNGMIAGLIVGFLTHGAFGGRALASPVEMFKWASFAREDIHQFLWAMYDVDVVKPPPPTPEPPKAPEEDTETPKPANLPTPTAPEAPPPPAAQAGKVLTAAADPNEPVDLTGNGFVTGEGEAYTGGVTAAAGTGTVATYNPTAKVGGTPGGTGSGKSQPPPPKDDGPDRSRPANVSPGANWAACPFPPEADADQVDYAVVTIVVTVRPDGSALSVRVAQDPGHGFGRAARMCALSQRYVTSLDRSGTPVSGTTPPVRVIFTR